MTPGAAARGVLLVACCSQPLSAAAAPPALVYLENATVSGDACAPGGCRWQVYDPARGTSALMLTTPDVPQNVFWQDGWVHYRIGNEVYRARWVEASVSEQLFTLPFDAVSSADGVEDIWQEPGTGAWKLTVLEVAGSSFLARLLARTAQGGWTLLDSRPTRCECGGCPCLDVLADRVTSPPGRVTLRALLEGMRIEHRARERGRVVDEADDGQELHFPSLGVEGRGVRVRVAIGDTAHAVAPLHWVPSQGEARLIAAPAERCPPTNQLGFEESGPYLLVASEYEGACPRVVEMRSGRTLKAWGADVRFAVWARP